MWNKTNSVWSYDFYKTVTSSDFSSNLEANNIFVVDGEDSYAHVYTPCWKFDDVYEYFRLYSSGYPTKDRYGFLIRGEFSPARAASYFSNIKTVRLATSNTSAVAVDDVTRRSADYISDFSSVSVIDGKELYDGDRVLVKDQYTETLTTYSYTSIGTYTVRILDNVSPFIREYFSDGNKVVFVDGNSAVSTGTIINKRIELITGSNYLVFDVYDGVPDSALGYTVADPTDGLWTKSWNASENTIYKYSVGAGLTEENDLETEDDARDAYVWVLEGDDNKDRTFRLDRDSDGSVIYGTGGSVDMYFTEVTPSVIQHRMNYNIDPVAPAYSSNRFKTLLLDYDMATKLKAYDTSSGTRRLKTGQVFSSYLFQKVKLYTSCDGETNILGEINDTIFSRSQAPNYAFVPIGVNQEQYKTVAGDVLLASTTGGYIEMDNNHFNTVAGDFIYVRGYDGSDMVFESTFIAQTTVNSTGGTDTFSLWPAIPSEVRTELADSGISFLVENLNVCLPSGPISLNNATFTTNLSGWSQTPSGIAWTAGSNRANVVVAGYNSTVLYQGVSFLPEKVYFTSIDYQSDTDIQIVADDGSGDFATVLETVPAGSGTYETPLDAGYVIPSGTTHIGFRVLALSTSLTATSTWIDNVVITTKSVPNIVSNINRSPVGRYYVASNPSGEILSLSFGDSTEGIYGNEEVEVKVNTGGGYVSALKLKYDQDRATLPKTIYSPFYNVDTLLDQIDGGTTFPSNYDFTQSHNDTFTYNNVLGSSRFGIENNKIHIGSALADYDYLMPGMYVEVYNNTTSSVVKQSVLIVKKVASGSEVVYHTNTVFDSSPSPGDSVQLRIRLVVSEMSDDLYSTLSGYNTPTQEAYAGFIAQSTDVPSNVTNILYKGYDGYPVLLSSLVPGDSSDARNDMAPIAYYRVGTDIKLQPAKVIADSDWSLTDVNKIEITSTSSLNTKIRFVDGLKEIYVSGQVTTDASGNDMTWQQKYGWILSPGVVVVNAVVGKDSSGNMIWYKGDWRSGVWEDGTWMSGTWRKGTWKGGTWNAYKISDDGNQNVSVIYGDTKDTYSTWYSGTWITGTWNQGTWKDGTWKDGNWEDGTWEDGTWIFGTWNQGTWKAGDWKNGLWNSGDFETGTWNAGTWNQSTSTLSRFGTKATTTDRAFWYGGTWNGGQFHSYMKLDANSSPVVSDDHSLSVWFAGTWNAGEWYGGTFVAGTWGQTLSAPSTWHGGVWLGGWRVQSITEQGSTKIITLDPGQYDTLLSISNTSHHMQNGQSVTFTGVPNADTAFSNALLTNKIVDNGSVIISGTTVSLANACFKRVTVLDDSTISITINQNIGSTTWYNDSQGVTSDSPDGRPMCGALWNGGTWKNGTWLNGTWTKGVFESGIFANGLFLQGDFGVSYI